MITPEFICLWSRCCKNLTHEGNTGINDAQFNSAYTSEKNFEDKQIDPF